MLYPRYYEFMNNRSIKAFLDNVTPYFEYLHENDIATRDEELLIMELRSPYETHPIM